MRALEMHHHDLGLTAEVLGIHRKTLQRKLRSYGLSWAKCPWQSAKERTACRSPKSWHGTVGLTSPWDFPERIAQHTFAFKHFQITVGRSRERHPVCKRHLVRLCISACPSMLSGWCSTGNTRQTVLSRPATLRFR